MGGSASKIEVPASGKMQRLVLKKRGVEMKDVVLAVEEVDIPTPQSGEVLVKVCAAPVNPSDYGNFLGQPSDDEQSVPIGKEGSGIIVESGKRIGFCNLPKGQGAYSEYVTVPSMAGTFAMPDDVKLEDACSFFVNPMTAYGILDTAATRGSPGLVHTAAASQLGKMLVKLTKQRGGVTLINVVRREEQAEQLKALGAEHVVVTNKDDWQSELKALIDEHKVTCAFDAVAGEMTGQLLGLLPQQGACWVYGGLSGQKVSEVNPMDLIYKKKELKGWFLPSWLKDDGKMSMLMKIRNGGNCVNEGLAQKDGWSSSKFYDCTMEDMWPKFLEMFNARGSGGFTDRKLRLRIGDDNLKRDE